MVRDMLNALVLGLVLPENVYLKLQIFSVDLNVAGEKFYNNCHLLFLKMHYQILKHLFKF